MRNVTGTVANKRQLFWFPQTRYSYLCTDFIRMIRNRRLLAVIDISHRQPKEANVYETLPYKGCALRTCVQDNANEDFGQITLAGCALDNANEDKGSRPDNISWLTRYCINTAFLLSPTSTSLSICLPICAFHQSCTVQLLTLYMCIRAA